MLIYITVLYRHCFIISSCYLLSWLLCINVIMYLLYNITVLYCHQQQRQYYFYFSMDPAAVAAGPGIIYIYYNVYCINTFVFIYNTLVYNVTVS